MDSGHFISNTDNLGDWAARAIHWSESSKPKPTPIRRKRDLSPLILCGHGVSLSIDRGALLIRDGLTHYPQERIERRIFPGDPTRPMRIIVLDGSGSLTFDVIDWLREQDVALVRVDWTGAATIVGGVSGYAADPAAWRRQEALRADPARRMRIAQRLIVKKLEGSRETLAGCIPSTPARAFALETISERLKRLRRVTLSLAELHGVEGRAAKVYFDAWVGTPLQWNAMRRRPVPEAWRAIGHRQSLATGKKGKNYAATHPVNAMLNYAYAVLESEVRLSVIAAGYDPLAGFLHKGRRGAPALVLDLMEPLRPVIDAAILRFVQSETFASADFILRSDGVVRLNPQLARCAARATAEAVTREDAPQLLSIIG